jgi:hypothetical protein
VLTRFLAERAGHRLDRLELGFFLHLAARLARTDRRTYVDGWQVCEWCDSVFSARQRNARRCAGCRRKRAPRLSPVREGGRHWGNTWRPVRRHARIPRTVQAVRSLVQFSRRSPGVLR